MKVPRKGSAGIPSRPPGPRRRVEVRPKSVCCDVRRLSKIRRMAAKEQTHLMTTCMFPLFWSGTWPRTLWRCRIRGGEPSLSVQPSWWSGEKSRKHPCLAAGTGLARWPCGWERVEGGWGLGVGTERACAERGVGGSEAGPLSTTTTTTTSFSIGTGARQFVPPLPSQREAPRSMMSTRLRGPGKPAAGLLTVQRSLSDLDPSSECQQTSTPRLHGHRRGARSAAQTWSISKIFHPPTTSTPCCWSSGKRLH